MKVLVDKQYKNYSYFSRYSSFPFYYNVNDGKYTYGITSQLSKDVTYVIYKAKKFDTWDSIALFYYNSPTYYWVLTDFNDVQDPFTQIQEGQEIKVPTLNSIVFRSDI